MTPLGFIARVIFAAACLLALRRSLSGWDWYLPTAGAMLLGISLTEVARSWRGRAIAILGSSVAAILYLTLLVYPELSFFGIPTPRSIGAAIDQMREGFDVVMTGVAPISVTAGILTVLIMSSALFGIATSLTAGPVTLIPFSLIFITASAAGEPGGRWFYLAAFLTCGLTLLVIDRSAPDGVSRPDVALSARLGALSIGAALLIPSVLPGFGGDFRSTVFGDLPSGRSILSPMVQLRPRLVDPDGSVMFRVVVSKPQYWRLASLDAFDGSTWSLKGTFEDADDAPGFIFTPLGQTETTQQNFLIEGLGGEWVPTAYSAVTVSGLDFKTEREKDTLIVEELKGGESYAVLSQVPVPAASELAQAGVGSGPDGTLELPDPVVQKIRKISLGVTEGTSNAYEAAVALQNHLRGFRYTLSVPGRHDGDFLHRFLTETKAGYCEQFAAAMAVMLRSIGIPSRVAVGFLPGTPEQGGFTVTNREAHAWTEAYFNGIGWVAFEPTPRAEATPPPYTRPEGEPEVVQEQPSSEGGEPAEPPVMPEVEDGSTVAAPRESSPLAIATKASKRLGILAVVLLVLAASSRQLALMALGRHRRKMLGADAAAFEEMMLLAEDAYRVRLVAETEYEFTRSLMKELELSPDDLGLALVDHWRICYGNGQASDGSQERIKRIRSAIRSNCSWRGKIRMALSPRPVVVLAQILAARFAATRSSSAARSV